MKERIRGITARNGGRSLESGCHELRRYRTGWKGYVRFAETPRIFRDLDEGIRHRRRMLQLKPWKRGTTIDRAMQRLGAHEAAARQVAANSRRWWNNSAKLLNTAQPTSSYARMGVPRLAHEPQPAEPPDTDPYVRGCGRGSADDPLTPIPIVRERADASPLE